MDYDSIAKGRRRNWEALKPAEVRRREREEERERKRAEDEAAGKRSVGFQEARRRNEEAKQTLDQVRYRAAVRQSIVLASIFVVVVAGYFGVRQIARSQFLSNARTEIDAYEMVLDEGKQIHDLSTPTGALASWRSAWMEKDVQRMVDLLSPGVVAQMGRGIRREHIIADYTRMIERGSLQGTIDLATNFAYAEILRLPSEPWRDQQLALFRSQPLAMGESEADDIRYVIAFSYQAESGKWHFADVREEKYFSVRWEDEPGIQPVRVGPLAAEYDERGYRKDPQ